jgi:hypothetical protein
MRCPVQHFSLFKPKSNFFLGIFDRVTSVANVTSHFNAKVSTNGSRGRVQRIGSTQHFASSRHGFLAFPNHANDGSRHHVLAKLGEERLGDQILVVSVQKFSSGLLGLQGGELVSLGFETADNVTNKSALTRIIVVVAVAVAVDEIRIFVQNCEQHNGHHPSVSQRKTLSKQSVTYLDTVGLDLSKLTRGTRKCEIQCEQTLLLSRSI